MGHLGGGLWQSDDQGKRGSRWLELVDGVSLLLPLPQLEVLAEDVHPSHGCESCEFISQPVAASRILRVRLAGRYKVLWSPGTSSGCRLTSSVVRLRGYLCCSERCSLVHMWMAAPKARKSSELVMSDSLLDQNALIGRVGPAQQWTLRPEHTLLP